MPDASDCAFLKYKYLDLDLGLIIPPIKICVRFLSVLCVQEMMGRKQYFFVRGSPRKNKKLFYDDLL